MAETRLVATLKSEKLLYCIFWKWDCDDILHFIKSALDYDKDYFKDYTAVRFKPKADCNVEIKECFKEAVLVIGELNEKVDYPDIEHFDETRVLEEVLLIS